MKLVYARAPGRSGGQVREEEEMQNTRQPLSGEKTIWHPLTQHSQLAASPPLVIDSASGSFLYDRNGRRWLDAVLRLLRGHRH